MSDAVIVSTARTPIGKAYRGALNNTHGATMGGHVARAALERAGIAPGEVDDVLFGAALPEGATGTNIARQIVVRAGTQYATLATARSSSGVVVPNPKNSRYAGIISNSMSVPTW